MLKQLSFAAVAATMVLAAGQARAAFVLYLDDPTTAGIDVIMADNSAAGTATGIGATSVPDADAASGQLLYNGAVGGFQTNVAVGISGGTSQGRLSLNSVTVSGASGPLKIAVSDTGYLLGGQPGLHTFASQLSNTGTAGTVSLASYLDPANSEFGTLGATVNSLGPFSPATGGSASQLVTLGATAFSLTHEVLISHVGGVSQFTALSTVNAVPEPASLIVWPVLGLVGLVAGRRSLRARA